MLNGPSLEVLCAIRSLAELQMYAGFHIITPTRLAKARKARDDFALLIKVSTRLIRFLVLGHLLSICLCSRWICRTYR